MGKRGGAKKLDPILERTFGWLKEHGFSAVADPNQGLVLAATFSTEAVVVRPTYEWRDGYADVTIARRWHEEPAPYWSQVHLHELLERAGRKRFWNEMPQWHESPAIEEVFARGASLLREVAADQLEGRDLELLDDIIAKRPRQGVPGLDFPSDEPWAASQEGLWFGMLGGPKMSIADAVEASRSRDPVDRAKAALRIKPGLAKGRAEQDVGHGRLRELLEDPDLDVRRAAASSLYEWGDPFSVGPILKQLNGESGEEPSPFAAAATFLAIRHGSELRQQVRDALDRFAARGPVAALQVKRLRWRLDDETVGYPLVINLWQPGPEDD